jgi:hypothetical protein
MTRTGPTRSVEKTDFFADADAVARVHAHTSATLVPVWPDTAGALAGSAVASPIAFATSGEPEMPWRATSAASCGVNPSHSGVLLVGGSFAAAGSQVNESSSGP